MPFAPNVQDRRDALIMQGSQDQNRYKMMGDAALAGGISQAGSSLGGALAQVGSQVQANAAKYKDAAGQLDAYKQVGSNMGMDMSYLADIEAKHGKNPDALLGALAVVGQDFRSKLVERQQEKQYGGALELAREKAALGIGGGSRAAAGAPMFGLEVGDGIDMSR
jgi:hypothetical protein